jgi:hypothetical protein
LGPVGINTVQIVILHIPFLMAALHLFNKTKRAGLCVPLPKTPP